MEATRRRITPPEATLLADSEPMTLPLQALTLDHLRRCSPIRTFRWHRGQRHFPGWYWSATDVTHVMYESRLELARLVLADFDPLVVAIRSQPFRLSYVDDDGRKRKHVPDFALLHRDERIRIVNVKPADRLSDPAVRALLDGAHAVLQRHGFDTEVWSAEHPIVMSTVTFLAGYRNPRFFNETELSQARKVVRGSMTVTEAEAVLRRVGVADPRPLLMHLLWTHHISTDLTQPLQLQSVVEAA